MSFSDTLKTALEANLIKHDDAVIETMHAYFTLLMQQNEVMNLTRVTGEDDAALRHFAQSAMLQRALCIPSGAHVIDVGTGGGFPGIPLAVLRPDISVTLIDATAKKLGFVKEAAARCGITNASAVWARAEEFGRLAAERERYDFAVSRAVAPLNILLELTAPFIKVGGTVAAFKGESWREEAASSMTAADKLGIVSRETFRMPDGGAVLLYDKSRRTPDLYPRDFRRIKASPL